MSDPPGDHPLPDARLSGRTPLIFTLRKGDVLYRHHQKIHAPVYFGATAIYRFDDPDGAAGSFGVLYAGADPECCFLESCGDTTGVPAVSGAYLDARAIARLELKEDLRFIDLVGEGGLTSIGADNRLCDGSYKIAQQWSKALREHPITPDGIRYRARHAPERIAYAIYTRSPATFSVTSMGSFTDPANDTLFKGILSTYKVDLI